MDKHLQYHLASYHSIHCLLINDINFSITAQFFYYYFL